jgi:uncharacterized protein (TIGR00255 family)
MTGFGTASFRRRGFEARAEIRTVNHKRLSLRLSLPPALAAIESEIEDLVRGRLARGSVTVSVTLVRSPGSEAAPLRLAAAKSAVRDLRKLQRALGLAGEVDLRLVCSYPGVFQSPSPDAPLDPGARGAAVGAVDRAIAGVLRRRASEGAHMAKTMGAILDRFEKHLAAVEARAPLAVRDHRDRLLARIRALVSEAALELKPEDLVRETALHADRVDVTEEITRLKGHLAELRRALRAAGEAGRAIEFLLQEVLRETNTIGSKANDGAITRDVVAMKGETERLRELAANVE